MCNNNFRLLLFRDMIDKLLINKNNDEIENDIKKFIEKEEDFKSFFKYFENSSYEELINKCTYLSSYGRNKLLILSDDLFNSIIKYINFCFDVRENEKYSTLFFINQNDFVDEKINFEEKINFLARVNFKNIETVFVYDNILSYELFFINEVKNKPVIFFYITENNFVENMNNTLFLEFLGKIKIKNLILLNLFNQFLKHKKNIEYDIKHVFKENIKLLNEMNIKHILLFENKIIDIFYPLMIDSKPGLFDNFSFPVLKSDLETKEYKLLCLLKELTEDKNRFKNTLFFLKYFFDTEIFKIILRELRLCNKEYSLDRKDILNLFSISNIIFDSKD
jgi:hypothetical protein